MHFWHSWCYLFKEKKNNNTEFTLPKSLHVLLKVPLQHFFFQQFTFSLKFSICVWRAQSFHKVNVCVPNVANSVINHIDLNCFANVSAVTQLLWEQERLSECCSLYFSLRPVCVNDYGFMNAPLRLSRLNFGAIILLEEPIMTHCLSLFS